MTDEGIITYEKLYDVLRQEKYKKELQKLESDFYIKVVRYLDEKNSILKSQESKDSVFVLQSVAKTKRQLENTKMILKELYEKREAKIIQIALFNSRTGEKLQETDALLDEELKMYNSMVSLFNSYREGILISILQGKLPAIKQENNFMENKTFENKNKLVKFLQSVPKFFGEDMKVYGPFETDDTAILPVKVCNVLIKNSKVMEV